MAMALAQDAAMDQGRVQSLKEIKKSRRTVMLGSALTLPTHGEGSVLSIPLTPPMSERASGEVNEDALYSPEQEERYENVDLSSDEDGEWDQSEEDAATIDASDEESELVEHLVKVCEPGQAGKPRLTSLRKILEQTPDRPLPRQSSLPSPPPMTIHDFWANVVRNYKLVHRTMPGFLFHKIRDGGVPSVLRRVVWTAMAGITPEYASEMTNIYSRLEVGGIGGWEKDIGRDLHRTWPDVEMFKEQNGEGQRGLRGVLGGYSVWDNHVGYCQGLGFLAGPLLMNTSSAAEAFTLLTVLMAQPSTSTSHNSPSGYSLRTLYTPNFPGLLSLIHAFNSVLTTQFPALSTHLSSMGLTTEMYAPQWFLSMFAVTAAPIDSILLRLWDLLMMEGSHGGHTMIRIGLSLMKLNQETLLELTEMEDCLKLLLSKSLWHNIDPDTLIGIAGGEMKTLVPSDKLSELNKEYELMTNKAAEEKKVGGELQAVASRFLGRLKWTASQLTVDTTNISPPMIRSISKASFTSSPQEISEPAPLLRAPPESMGMTRSTSSASFRGTSDNERALHAQIEDLVKVLGDVQRQVGESEGEKDSLRSENARLREMLARVASAMGGSTSVEDLNIPERPSPLSSLSDEISEILSSPSSPASSITNCTESPLEEELRTQLTETQHTLNQERQANLLLQQQLSTTETELSRTRTALLELRTKYTDENRRARTPSSTPSERSASHSPSNSSLRELKLVVRTKSETLIPPPTPTAGSSSAGASSAGSTWGSWFGRKES